MSQRVHVTLTLDLFVEDAEGMRKAAYERLKGAWSSEDDFPYESASDVPLEETVHSLLADALPANMPGCRRSSLNVEVEEEEDDSDDGDSDSGDSDDGDSDSSDSDDGDSDDSESDSDDGDSDSSGDSDSDTKSKSKDDD
jgi:hypothetical protein